jgi:hypothetical protein
MLRMICAVSVLTVTIWLQGCTTVVSTPFIRQYSIPVVASNSQSGKVVTLVVKRATMAHCEESLMSNARLVIVADSLNGRSLDAAMREFAKQLEAAYFAPDAGRAVDPKPRPTFNATITIDVDPGRMGAGQMAAQTVYATTAGAVAQRLIKVDWTYGCTVEMLVRRFDGTQMKYSAQASSKGKAIDDYRAVFYASSRERSSNTLYKAAWAEGDAADHAVIVRDAAAQCMSQIIAKAKSDTAFWSGQ